MEEHLRENLLGEFAGQVAFRDEVHQFAKILGWNRRIGDLLTLGVQGAHQVAHHPVRRAARVRAILDHLLVILAQRSRHRQHFGVVFPQAVLLDEPGALGGRQFRHRRADLGQPPLAHAQRQQIRFGEVAVIVSVLLAPHRHGFAGIGVVQAGLLNDLAAALDDGDLALDLVVESLLEESERVQVFHLDLRAESLRAAQAHRHVGVATQVSLLHIARRDFGELEQQLQLVQVSVGLVRIPQVGFGDDLDQRRAAAVEVDVGVPVRVAKAVVQALAGVVFHVDPRDAGALVAVFHDEVDPAVLGQRLIVLRDLVALRQVRIEVVLPGENRLRANLAVHRQRGLDRHLDGVPVQHGQRAGQPQADRAHVGVRGRAETGRAGAEDFRTSGKLDMHLQADDRLVPGEHLGRDRSFQEGGHSSHFKRTRLAAADGSRTIPNSRPNLVPLKAP